MGYETMASSPPTGKLEFDVEIDATPEQFHHMWAHRPHHVHHTNSEKVQSCDLHQGEFGKPGANLFWNYVHGTLEADVEISASADKFFEVMQRPIQADSIVPDIVKSAICSMVYGELWVQSPNGLMLSIVFLFWVRKHRWGNSNCNLGHHLGQSVYQSVTVCEADPGCFDSAGAVGSGVEVIKGLVHTSPSLECCLMFVQVNKKLISTASATHLCNSVCLGVLD
ncbi:MLP-like protein 34 [Hibiscus syriacus]|uniref:MLP-like protein 34 n=1 Tax=Hibiscus syriacus TaxID=106335 RepID=A0A6A3B0P1_HIBSY|nr:MLP-like protein 34 [Hibiscus syriacus]